jgi:lipopolysaccharide/colanic/teichoic acid biosynthesis glycosyltransferase
VNRGLRRELWPAVRAGAFQRQQGEQQVFVSVLGSFAKRCFDLAAATLALAISTPIMAVAAFAVAVESGFPAIYRQIRVGRNGSPFVLYKIRTMRRDAEADTGPVWAVDGDPRGTRIGGILRQLSLDELPQLINVLKGDMSLVGPRPERPFFVERFRSEIRGYDGRHEVKPGITGWAQIHGLRGNTSIEKRTQCDLCYVRRRCLVLDVHILAATVVVVMGGTVEFIRSRWRGRRG